MVDLSFNIYENIALQSLRDQYVVELASELNYQIVKLRELAQNKQSLFIVKGDKSAIRSVVRDLAENHLKLRYSDQWIKLDDSIKDKIILGAAQQILKIVFNEYATLTEEDIYVMGPVLLEANFLNYTTNKPIQNA